MGTHTAHSQPVARCTEANVCFALHRPCECSTSSSSSTMATRYKKKSVVSALVTTPRDPPILAFLFLHSPPTAKQSRNSVPSPEIDSFCAAIATTHRGPAGTCAVRGQRFLGAKTVSQGPPSLANVDCLFCSPFSSQQKKN